MVKKIAASPGHERALKRAIAATPWNRRHELRRKLADAAKAVEDLAWARS